MLNNNSTNVFNQFEVEGYKSSNMKVGVGNISPTRNTSNTGYIYTKNNILAQTGTHPNLINMNQDLSETYNADTTHQTFLKQRTSRNNSNGR